MSIFANQNRNSASFKNYLKHGSATQLSDLANFTFNDVVFPDGTVLKDVTFAQLTDQVWATVSRNAATYVNATRN